MVFYLIYLGKPLLLLEYNRNRCLILGKTLRSFTLLHGPTKLYFGLNVVQCIKKRLEGSSKVAIVTGRSSAKVSGALDDVVDILKDLGIEYEVISGVTPNPWDYQADEVALKIWELGADAVIAIGGGSVVDTAKFATVIASCGGRAKDYLCFRRRACQYVRYLIAINLTHGTGTEVDRYGVLTIKDTREKRGVPILYPRVGVDDPRYTLTLPLNQTIYTSLDAFYHAYESATTKETSPYIELLSEESIRLIHEWLPKVIKDLRDLRSRYYLLYASMLAGIAIDSGSTHLVHAIEHALSGIEPKLAHGAGLAMIGPKIVELTHKVRPEESARVLKSLDPNIKAYTEEAPKARRVVEEFQGSIGFKERLSDYGIGKDDFKEVIELVMRRLRYLWEEVTPFTVSEELINEILKYAE